MKGIYLKIIMVKEVQGGSGRERCYLLNEFALLNYANN